MDREQLINTITQEVLRQVQSMQASQSTQSVSTVSTDSIFLSDMRPGVKLTEIMQLLERAKTKNCGICVPQWFVATVKEKLNGCTMNMATVVGLPNGTTSPLAKYAEIKQAVTFGANTIFVPINMDLCKAGDVKGVQKDLAESITASKGKAESVAIIEVNGLGMSTITDTAMACTAAGADGVILSGITGGSVDASCVRELKTKGIRVGVMGGITGRESMFKQAQADWIVVRN